MDNFPFTQRGDLKSYFDPLEKDYSKVLLDPTFSSERKIFSINSENYTEYEKKMCISFKDTFYSNDVLAEFFSFKGLKTFVQEIINKEEDCLRFLSMFSFDINLALENIEKMVELMNLHNLENFKNYTLNQGPFELGTKLFENSKKIFKLLPDKDKSFRPNIQFALTGYDLFLSLNFNRCDFMKSIFYFFNWILDSHLIPGKIEQFNLFLNIKEIILIDYKLYADNPIDLLKLFQYAYPERINKIFIYVDSIDCENSLIKYIPYVFQHNKAKIIVININDWKSEKEIDVDVDNKMLENVFSSGFIIKSSIFKKKKYDVILIDNNSNIEIKLDGYKNLKKSEYIKRKSFISLSSKKNSNSYTGNGKIQSNIQKESSKFSSKIIVGEKDFSLQSTSGEKSSSECVENKSTK